MPIPHPVVPTVSSRHRRLALALASAAAIAPALLAQDRLKTMPGYEQYHAMSGKIPGALVSGALTVKWVDEGKALEYRKNGKSWRYDIASGSASEVAAGADSEPSSRPGGRGGGRGAARGEARGGRIDLPAEDVARVERGRQTPAVASPDGKLRAFHRQRNLWLRAADGAESAVTTEGDEKTRIKFASASWVYGEELRQTTAMWWSPDSQRIAFYRFDESGTPDYYLQLDQTKVQSRMDIEAYPKAGAKNPVADLLVYDLASQKTVTIDVRDGKPFADDVVGHYAYGVAWSPNGKELLLHRTNRRQNVMELCAADPENGKCRVVVREEWPASWTENTPPMRFLSDGMSFVWTSERTGFRNYYLYDLGGKLLATLTSHPFEVAGIVRIDEKSGHLWYLARSGDNHMKQQLHRVGLDGQGDRRLTDPALNHTVELAPDGRHFADVAQTHDVPPSTRLVDASGKVVKVLAESDLTKFDELGLKKVELIRYPAGDGTTELHGLLHFPSRFDPEKKYPLLVTVYAGPATNGARETFTTPNPLTEYGFLVASLDSRSAGGRGKRALDAIYGKLGTVEIDDQAAGVRSLGTRDYVDLARVGIFGTSYGGYASVMCLLRHPDLFEAACASSPVTDWRHYDTIYTERYMYTPQENKAGYDAGSAMTYADKLRGRLMLYYGTADNNVHPNNTMQLVGALQRAGKSFELQVGPDRGHSGISPERMMEFFIANLVISAPTLWKATTSIAFGSGGTSGPAAAEMIKSKGLLEAALREFRELYPKSTVSGEEPLDAAWLARALSIVVSRDGSQAEIVVEGHDRAQACALANAVAGAYSDLEAKGKKPAAREESDVTVLDLAIPRDAKPVQDGVDGRTSRARARIYVDLRRHGGSRKLQELEMELLRSPQVLRAACRSVRDFSRDALPMTGEPLSAWWLARGLAVTLGRGDDIIEVELSGPGPGQTSELVNRIVEAFIAVRACRPRPDPERGDAGPDWMRVLRWAAPENAVRVERARR